MANTIKIKNSGTALAVPSSLEHGELGLNYADGKIYFKNLSNAIVELSGTPSVVIQSTAPTNTNILWADTSVTGVGVVPVGGTTGQVLSKGSNTSYDAVWANAVSSSDLSLKANTASPTFTGTVTIPAGASISGFAPLANPALTGTPTAPTATAATNTTQIATTEFVRTEVANLVASAPAALDTLDELAAALGDDANFATTTATAIGLKAPLASPTFTGTVTIPAGASISGFAPLASPALTGTPTAPTANSGTNTTQVATTAFVTTAVSGATITSLDDVADVTITTATSGDLLKWSGTAWVNTAGYALLASPTFTGTPTLPTGTIATTQSPGSNTTAVATTAFVTAGIAALVVDPLNNPKFSAIITMDVI